MAPFVLGALALGAVLTALAWRFTRRLPTWVRLLPPTLFVAMAIAPCLVFGREGCAFVPAFLVLFHSPLEAAVPIAVEWAALYVVSVTVYFFYRLVARRFKSPWLVMLLAGIAVVVAATALIHIQVAGSKWRIYARLFFWFIDLLPLVKAAFGVVTIP